MIGDEDYIGYYEGSRVVLKEKEEKAKRRRKKRVYRIISAIGIGIACALYVLIYWWHEGW